MNSSRRVLILAILLHSLIPGETRGGDLPWPARNGPTFNGVAKAEDARGAPTIWDEAGGKNIAWKISLEGYGHSTPVIGHGKLWLTTATLDGKQQYIQAIDASTGQILHRKLLFENKSPEPLGNVVNTYASPSCFLEDDAVYAHFGTYGTARIDPETAEVVWRRRDLNCRHFRGPGSSPVVWRDLVILTFDGIDQQFLVALDKRTGKNVWRINRSTDYHDLGPDGKPMINGDYRKAYGTPGVIEVPCERGRPASQERGRPARSFQLVSIGSRAIFGYDVATGKEIWTVTHGDFNAAAPPLFFENTAIVNTGSGGANFMAIRLDESTRGDVTKTHIVWNRTKGNSRLSAPVLDKGRIWMLTDNGVLYCLDAKTGHELSALRLGGSYVASPLIAGDLLYAPDEKGTTTVVRTTVPPEIVSKNRLADGMRASPSIAAGALYLRTYQHLYKIAAAK